VIEKTPQIKEKNRWKNMNNPYRAYWEQAQEQSMKFLFDLQASTLKIAQGENNFLVLEEDRQFRKLGGIGFVLDYMEPSRS